ncbi:hypothetical protein IG631_22511 [Alternaria alternata]|nr:hypothetical protein IG631_22511 [Alternaria alternata]
MPAGQHTQSRAITSDSTKKDSLLALQKSFQSSCLRPNIAAGPMSLTLQDYPLLTDIESDPAAPGEHHAGLSPGCKGNPGHISCISDHQATASRMDSQDNHDIMALIAGKTLIVANDQRARCPISTQSANIPSEHLSWTGILPWHPPVRRNPSSRVLRAGEIVGVQPFPNSPRLHTHKVDDLLCFSRRLDFRSK